MFEGNQYGFHTTAHACEVGEPYSVDTCNHNGQCTVDVQFLGVMTNPQSTDDPYGPESDGTDYTIDSTQPFIVRHEFKENVDGEFYDYTTELE